MQPTGFCTPGHCVYPYDPTPEFEILDTDSEAMKQAKQVFNSSSHECHPNYMSGIEQYKLIRAYKKEREILIKIWEEKAKNQQGFFSFHHDQIMQGKSDLEELKDLKNRSDASQRRWTYQLVDRYPKTAATLVVLGVVAYATTFFHR